MDCGGAAPFNSRYGAKKRGMVIEKMVTTQKEIVVMELPPCPRIRKTENRLNRSKKTAHLFLGVGRTLEGKVSSQNSGQSTPQREASKKEKLVSSKWEKKGGRR